jgi:tetratricopeptide (TPR) repeat protein
MVADIRNPYVGPRPFERQESKIFFGRDKETQEIVSLIFAHPILLVYAQSGAGKTSLFNAQIIPTLERKGLETLPPTRVKGAILSGEKHMQISNLYIFNALFTIEKGNPHTLTNLSLPEYLKKREHNIDKRGRPQPRVLLFDQFEELFSTFYEHWQEQRDNFFSQIAESLNMDPLLRIVLIMREDSLAQLEPFARSLPGELRARFRLEKLRRESALMAIKKPIEGTDYAFAEGVAEGLVDNLLKMRVETPFGDTEEVRGEFVESVQLQVVCQRLWEQVLHNNAKTITEGYVKDIDRSLAIFYEDAINAATSRTDISEEEIRNWCEYSLITSAGTRNLIHRDRDTTAGMPNMVVDILAEKLLITSEIRAGARWFELTHDSMIQPIKSSNAKWYKQRDGKIRQISSYLVEAEQFISSKKYDKGLANLEQSYKLSKEIGELTSQGDAKFEIAALYYDRNRNGDAIKFAKEALEIYLEMNDNSRISSVSYFLGNIFHERGEYELAHEHLTRAIEYGRNYYNYFARGHNYWYWARHNEALSDFNIAGGLLEQEYPNMNEAELANLYSSLGQVLAEMENFTEAIQVLTQAIEIGSRIGSDVAYARSGLGLAYGGLGKHKQALEEFQKSIKAAPGNAWVYYNRGLIYFRNGDLKKAKADFMRALIMIDPKLNSYKREKAQIYLEEIRKKRNENYSGRL